MRFEAVIVCVNYADFLSETLPLNLDKFDELVVVTTEDDKATQGVCAKNSVKFITTPLIHEKGHAFNKGAGINFGIDQLKQADDTWFVHIDADIVLPRDFRRLVHHAQLRKDCIYGADRVNVYGYEAWHALKPKLNNAPSYQDRWFIDPGHCHSKEVPHGTRFGTRVVHHEYGWIPIGFCQIWHSQSGKRYNNHRGSGSGTDVYFPAMWSRDKRVLLPEIVVHHLDSATEHKMGTNWHGRKSKEFKPSPKEELREPTKEEFLKAFGSVDMQKLGDLDRLWKEFLKWWRSIFCPPKPPPPYCP